jgi:RecA/RadA recombinase
MTDYDFQTLNDKEFEIFSTDLLSEVEGYRFERFKAGRDGGVDGRYFASHNKEVILQCKHWSNTPFKKLVAHLRDIERPKLEKLEPHRYLLALSTPLSRVDKKSIQRAFEPYIIEESDIFGREDLNDLLKKFPHIEKRHYKLWLQSSTVLGHIFNNAIFGRSAFSLEEIIQSSARYVVTANHQSALGILEKLRVVIVTGEPGVGKTTLADHLCLQYVSEGFAYLKIGEDIREAESVFDSESKQVIYFDDFLGRNYLEALTGHEGSHITQFIRRIAANKNKRFVLTSRSTILNQGKLLIDNFEHDNVGRNEYELRIQSLTDLDKAQILYNHIWHSKMESEYVDQLYLSKRYRKVISHPNFNPRLISYITDATRLEGCAVNEYWSYINQSLDNPSQIWDNAFVAQLDDFTRAITFLVVINGRPILESALADAYRRYIGLLDSLVLKGRPEFQSNIRLLTGSFLNRNVSRSGVCLIDLFNPSIGDYVLGRYAQDKRAIALAMLSLRTESSLMTLQSLHSNKLISEAAALWICDFLLEKLVDIQFDGADMAYVSLLSKMRIDHQIRTPAILKALSAAVSFIVTEKQCPANDDSFSVIEWALSEDDFVDFGQAINFVKENIDVLSSDHEIRAAMSLVAAVSNDTLGRTECLDSLNEYVFELIAENFDDFIDVSEAFSKVDYDDHEMARQELEKLVCAKLEYLGLTFNNDDVVEIVNSYDVPYELERYLTNGYDDDGTSVASGPTVLAFDEVDDLFDRK